MLEIIQQLLLSNNCVIVPGFGAFIGNYNHAEIHLQQNIISPPSKNLAFNRSIQNNDGILLSAVATHFSISANQAEEKITEFVKQANISLQENKSFILNDIGRLILDEHETIHFQPYFTHNYLLDSYGLSTLSIHPIRRLKDNETAIHESYQRIINRDSKANQSKSNFIKIFTSAAVVFVLAISSYFIFQQNKNYTQNHQSESSLISVFDSSPTKSNSKNETLLDSNTKSVIANKNVILKDTIATSISNPSYIVIGTFFDTTLANKLIAEAEAKGYTIKVAKDDNYALFRITVLVESDQLTERLSAIKSELNERAWVYCVNLNIY